MAGQWRDPFQEKKEVYKPNPKSLDGVPDLCMLTYLAEENVLHNLGYRYKEGKVYTSTTSKVLIAVNPYERMDAIYTEDMMKKYQAAEINLEGIAGEKDLPPHVFTVANAAYNNLLAKKQNQSIIVCGESGSGKTESAKYQMRFLAFTTTSGASDQTEFAAAEKIGQQVLDANPILESFGNAKTLLNNNSSRFGKFTKMLFEEVKVAAGAKARRKLVGAAIETYLLEKSRVVRQDKGERNFHIFYQLTTIHKDRPDLKLGPSEQFHYVNQSGVNTLDDLRFPGKAADAEWHKELTEAWSTLLVPKTQVDDIYKTVSGILHIGNVNFEQLKGEGSDIKNRDEMLIACEMFGVPEASLEKRLKTRSLLLPGDKLIVKPLNEPEAVFNRDSVSRNLYNGLFRWIVNRINQQSNATEGPTITWIGILDVFGFEIFDHNSFEQFCINFANERLQQYFNEHVLKAEQDLYKREALLWDPIDLPDNQDCIDLVMSKPYGILPILDSTCVQPKGTDVVFTANLFKAHKYHPRLRQVTQHKKSDSDKQFTAMNGFVIRHYAGAVIYDCAQFLEKNADASEFDTVELFMESKSQLQTELLRIRAGGQIEDGKRSAKRAFLSTGTVFSDQLQSLMTTLKQTSPYFVRCIKPNQLKAPKQFEGEYVRPQLRCGGLIEALRIIKLGFPTRCAYKRVHEMFAPILKEKPVTNLNQRDFTEAIMFVMGDKKSPVLKSDYQLGLSMVFFRPGKQTFLTDILERKPETVTADEKKAIRKFMIKKRWIRGRGTVRALLKTGKMLNEMRFKKAAISMVLIYRSIGRYLQRARETINGKLREADDERKKRDLQFQAALKAAEDLKKLQKQKEEMDAALRKQAEDNQRMLAEKDAAMEKQEQRLREFMEKLQEANNKAAELQKKQLGLHQSSKEREQELNSKIIEVGAEKDRAQAQVRTLEGQVAGKTDEINQKDRVIAERQGQIDGLKRDVASLKEQMDQQTESSDGALAAKIKEMKDAKEAFETEQSKLQGEIQDKQGELERLKGDLMNSEGKQRDLREQIERQGRSNDEKSADYDRQLADKDRQIAALQAEIESLKKRLEEAKTQAEAAAKAAADSLKQARQEAKDQQAKMDRAISDKESEISRLQNELAVLRASMESQSKNNAETLAQEREESRDRAEKQEKQLAEKDAELNRVKRELALTSGKLDAAVASNTELNSKHSNHVHETAEKLQEAAEKNERLVRKTDAKLAEAQSELALYKDRLENASRELKATSQRNEDNMAVLDRQLKDKDTALAELKAEYRKLQARLDTLTSTSGDKVALLQEQLNARRTEQRESQAKFEKEMWEKNRELGEVKSEVEVLRGRLSADRERFDTEKKLFDDQLAQAKNDSASRLESLDQELKSRNGDLAELKQDYKQDKKEWKEKQEKFEKQIGDLERKVEAKEDEIVSAQAKLSLLEKTSKQAAEEAQNNLQKAISKNQSASEDWKSQERELSGQVSFLTEERRKAVADLETERSKARDLERKHREDLEKKRSDYDRLEKEFVSYRGEVGASNEAKMQALAGQVQTLQTMLDDEKHDKEEAKKRESEYRERMKDASSQLGEALSELKHIQTTHGTELEKLRLELETAREKHVLESQAWKDQADAYERQVIEKTSLVNELKADLAELSEREAAATGALKQKSLGSRDELRKLKMQNEEYEFEQKNWLERQAAYEARLTKSSIDVVEAHSALAESERKLDSAIQDLKVEVEVLQAQLEAERKASHDRETDFDRELKLHKERFAKELSRVTSQAERDILMREQRLKTQEDTYKYRIQYLELAQKHSQQRQQQQSSS